MVPFIDCGPLCAENAQCNLAIRFLTATGNALKALARAKLRALEGPELKTLSEAAAKKKWAEIKARASEAHGLARAILAGDEVERPPWFEQVWDGGFAHVCEAVEPSVRAFESMREVAEKKMRALALALPAGRFMENCPGFGELSLARIVAELGHDLRCFSGPAKVWKMLGLAPKECYKMTCTNGQEALAVPRRKRSVMYVIEEAMIKSNRKQDGSDGHYRALYLARKEFEAQRNPAFLRKTDDQGKKFYSRHCALRASRFMSKALLKDLWIAWHLATEPDKVRQEEAGRVLAILNLNN